ncbi:MAG: type II toxin-antitoxin system Phd/YefM family antitoxin [Verrucomicrobia bacterium]|jgi:PHD/YefM family antitoxin component YafN of YafNO toxin-antitoxin module|nr:type II toxin-antitoxin system Phd/YefM family antitoxin [Verrucomicrobiota bacterium]
MSIHPQVIEKDGKKEFVVIPYDEFLAIQDQLEDYQDLMDLREAKRESLDEPSVPLHTVRLQLLNP